VTAALDTAHGRTVIFSVRNRAKSATTATFTAEANVTQPVSMMSRALPVGQEVWKQEYTVNLQPGETKELAVELPEAAFVKQKSQPAPKPNSKQTPLLMRPGSSFLTLSAQDTPEPQSIRALTLTTVKPVPTAAAKGNS
jgi:hypothetical protein